jgi:hypothetical protein
VKRTVHSLDNQKKFDRKILAAKRRKEREKNEAFAFTCG